MKVEAVKPFSIMRYQMEPFETGNTYNTITSDGTGAVEIKDYFELEASENLDAFDCITIDFVTNKVAKCDLNTIAHGFVKEYVPSGEIAKIYNYGTLNLTSNGKYFTDDNGAISTTADMTAGNYIQRVGYGIGNKFIIAIGTPYLITE